MINSMARSRDGANYFRNISFKGDSRMKTLRYFLSILAIVLSTGLLTAQGCADALTNQLCADQSQPADSLSSTPFSSACLDAQQTYFYSFHTNDIADVGSVSIAINNYDCDDILGNDSIVVMVVAIPAGADPCDPSSYVNPECYGDSASFFSLDVSGLSNNQDYLVIVGSDHDATYGPCLFDVNISGSAVDVSAEIEPLIVSLGESATLHVYGADPAGSINWSPPQYLDDPTSADPVVTAEETTSFEVTATIGGCEVTDIITLTVGPPVEIFNTFTPNSDGINDTWRIKYIERFTNCQVEVFDRWGQSIFKSVGYAQPWDGTYKGKYLPTGAYLYVLELNSLEVTIPPITGVVSIVH